MTKALTFKTNVVRDLHGLAEWLVDETALSWEQIAEYAGIPEWQVQSIGNGTAKPSSHRFNPLMGGLLTEDEIARCSADPAAHLEKNLESVDGEIEIRAIQSLNDVREQAIHKIHLGVTFFIHYERNAWHSTWISRYTPGSIQFRVEDAERFAEARRTQGSVFLISELPAVFLQGQDQTIVVCEINGNDETARIFPLKGALFARRVVKQLLDVRENSVIALTLPSNINAGKLAAGRPLRTWRSRRAGQHQPLAWDLIVENRLSTHPLDVALENMQAGLPATRLKLELVKIFFPDAIGELSCLEFHVSTAQAGWLRIQCRSEVQEYVVDVPLDLFCSWIEALEGSFGLQQTMDCDHE